MTQLYPIGTQLITRRLSQAALCAELFGCESVQTSVPWYALKNKKVEQWRNYFTTEFCGSKCLISWRVTVTEENQAWLSPVPIVGDLVDVDQRYSVPTTIYISKYDVGLLGSPTATVKRTIERTYPNGQRAPMIEWNTVILPAEGTQS